MTVEHRDQCRSCAGYGWKFVTLRRSPLNAGSTGESAALRRARVACLACAGTGCSGSS